MKEGAMGAVCRAPQIVAKKHEFASVQQMRTNQTVPCSCLMKNRFPLLLTAAVLAAAAGVYLYFFGGPYRFTDLPLREESRWHLRSVSPIPSPADAAVEYLHCQCHPQDRPKRSELEISETRRSTDEAVVTVIVRGCADDSVSASADRLTLVHENGRWIPARHEAAWQGRKRFGWSTNPPP
jgi:hypothetical protein